jgi:hypothetical protein
LQGKETVVDVHFAKYGEKGRVIHVTVYERALLPTYVNVHNADLNGSVSASGTADTQNVPQTN